MTDYEDLGIHHDETDPFKKYRSEFFLRENQLYMDGNSLGLMSKRAERSLLDMMESWKTLGIDAWTEGSHPWFYFSEKLSEKTAPIIGAKSNEVIVTGSITINLHQMLSTFYQPNGKRKTILADHLTFPSDIYAIKSHLQLRGMEEADLVQVGLAEEHLLSEDEIINKMTPNVALILLPSVLYRSGQLLDIKRITEEANRRGIIIGFDLAHSIGAIPHELHDWGVDFAVWCNYKYLNSGPGGVGGLFVHEKHSNILPGIAGWFGSDKSLQFDMSHTFTPADSAGAFQVGTPHIFSLAPLKGSLEIFEEVGMEAIRKKSLSLTNYLMKGITEQLSNYGFTMINPTEDSSRGGHVALVHPEAARICKALKADDVIPDFRSPNIIRLAPIAFYTSYQDVYHCVQILKVIMEEKRYEKFENTRNVVA
jgi:kynureninase